MMRLYLYDVIEMEERGDEPEWDMTIEEFIEAYNAGDESYHRGGVYIFTNKDDRQFHQAQTFADILV